MISQDDRHRQEVLRIFDAVLVERVDSHNSQDRSRPTHDQGRLMMSQTKSNWVRLGLLGQI